MSILNNVLLGLILSFVTLNFWVVAGHEAEVWHHENIEYFGGWHD